MENKIAHSQKSGWNNSLLTQWGLSKQILNAFSSKMTALSFIIICFIPYKILCIMKVQRCHHIYVDTPELNVPRDVGAGVGVGAG